MQFAQRGFRTSHAQCVVRALAIDVTTAPLDAELFGEIGSSGHDARFDQDLTYGNVELRNNASKVFQAICSISNDDRVGTLVDDYTPAVGEHGTRSTAASFFTTALKQAEQRRGARIPNLHELGAQGCKFRYLFTVFQFKFFACGDLRGRRNQQHVADLTLIKTFGLQNELERLIPGHILQSQRNTPRDRVTGNQVQIGKIGDQLQDRTNFDVLEIQRELFAAEFENVFPLRNFLFGEGRHFHRELIVGLIGEVVVVASGCNGNADVIALLNGVNHSHGRCEVGDIKPAPEIGRKLGIADLDADLAAITFDVDGRLGIGQLDHHAATAVLATSKIHSLNLRADYRLHTRILG